MSLDADRLLKCLPQVRGRIEPMRPLAPLTWFRVGGPAQILFVPEDEKDLADFLYDLPLEVEVNPIGVGSNLLVRDRGVPGVTIRLSSAFAAIEPLSEARIYAGAAALDTRLARVAAESSIGGLEFFSGIPGTIGGALRMNAGCYGSDTASVLVNARAITREGKLVTLSPEELGYSYRHCKLAEDRWLIFVGATFAGYVDDADRVRTRMDELIRKREQTQPVREMTGGSTFANPAGESGAAWRLIDAAGCRGLKIGGAQISEKHCNFMINLGDASAQNLEDLAETVRNRVFEKSKVELRWEIRRIGTPSEG